MENLAKDKDQELWRRWKNSGSNFDLEALMLQMRPVTFREINKWTNVVAPIVLEAEAHRLALDAFKTYDPAQGTQLSTHLINRLMKLSRIAYSHQSTVSVPEHQRITYNRMQRFKNQLEDELGHPPTVEHLADHMGLSVPKIQQLISNVEKRELMESGDGPAFQIAEDRASELIELAYARFTQRQKDIFDYRTGSHGKKQLKNPQILSKMPGLTQGVLSYEISKISEDLQRIKRLT